MELHYQLRVVRKIRETADTATFHLEPTQGATFPYQPGQYLSLLHGGDRRAYSFSSCPGVDPLPAITVRRVPNGVFSNWLLQEVTEGDVLQTTGAHGLFTLPPHPASHYVFVAAGSGITPILSQIKYLLSQTDTPRILLLYANRDSGSTIFKHQIDAWISAYPGRFHCRYYFSRESGQPNAVHGHLQKDLLEAALLAFFGGRITNRQRQETRFFLCAPNALMRMAEMTLHVLDFPAEHIHRETFLPDNRHQLRQPDLTRTHRIVVRDGEQMRSFDIFAGETILNGALRQGIELPYTCKSGVCFSCLARCTKGAVDVDFVEMTRREGPGALVNTCIGYAVTEEVELRLE